MRGAKGERERGSGLIHRARPAKRGLLEGGTKRRDIAGARWSRRAQPRARRSCPLPGWNAPRRHGRGAGLGESPPSRLSSRWSERAHGAGRACRAGRPLASVGRQCEGGVGRGAARRRWRSLSLRQPRPGARRRQPPPDGSPRPGRSQPPSGAGAPLCRQPGPAASRPQAPLAP